MSMYVTMRLWHIAMVQIMAAVLTNMIIGRQLFTQAMNYCNDLQLL